MTATAFQTANPTEWVAVVAHDALQPANAIMLATELLLRRGSLDALDEAAVLRMRRSLTHLVRLISDLTDMAALEAGRCALQTRDVELGALVLQMTEEAIWQRVRVSRPERSIFVRADADRLLQVLENLLSNAVKYGDPTAPIDLVLDVEGSNARLRVSNRGVGIPDDAIATVFDRYVRTREAIATAHGQGLGLYIARCLVEAQGGRIWAESGPKETSFHISLPLVST